MRIAHISDPHLTSGPLAAETATGLSLALRRAAALDPAPDCMVITGDLADHGRPEEYAILRELISECPLPLYLAIGNHDDRAAFLDVFTGTELVANGRQAYYAVDHPDATLIVLDSKDDGTGAAGRLGPEQLGWLDEQLSRRPDIPVLICLHHPPVAVGIPVLDDIRLTDAGALEAVLGGHRPAARILAGHVHRAITASFAGSVVSIAPSTYRQVDLQQCHGRVTGYVHEPAGFLLHLLTEAGCVTHTVPTTDTSAPFGIV